MLTPGPGRLKEVIRVPIPRGERSWDGLAHDARFRSLRERVLDLVRTDLRGAA